MCCSQTDDRIFRKSCDIFPSPLWWGVNGLSAHRRRLWSLADRLPPIWKENAVIFCQVTINRLLRRSPSGTESPFFVHPVFIGHIFRVKLSPDLEFSFSSSCPPPSHPLSPIHPPQGRCPCMNLALLEVPNWFEGQICGFCRDSRDNLGYNRRCINKVELNGTNHILVET